jgi:hypothetical protein
MTNARGIWFVLALVGAGCSPANGSVSGEDGGTGGTAGTAGTAGASGGVAGSSGGSGAASGGVGNVSGTAGFASGGVGNVAGTAGFATGGANQGGTAGAAGGSAGFGAGGVAGGAGQAGAGMSGGGAGGMSGGAGAGGAGAGGGGAAGAAGAGNDGCSNTQAGGIAISEVAFYQAVKIPVMEDMQEVGDRNADVVAGRAALVRVFVEPGGGFTRREIAARLTLSTNGTTKVHSAKLNPAGASSDGSPNSTFNIQVPAADITPDTEYSVELVECATPAGTASNARFPASGTTPLEARETGVMKITIVPIEYGADGSNRAPDTSAARIATYTEHIEKVYPVTEVQMTVREAVTSNTNLSSGNGWQSTLYALADLRAQDNPDDEVYYYGLVNPGQDLGDYCGGGCTAGIAFVAESAGFSDGRVGFGIGFSGSNQEINATYETMAHEIGHEHGRGHSPCGVQGDGPYPHQGGSIGSWGYDLIEGTLFDPEETTDIMGYCQDVWVSDFTYQAFVERVAALNGNLRIIKPPAAWYRTLLVDASAKTQWAFKPNGPRVPTGKPETARVLGADGKLFTEVTVYRLADSEHGYSVMIPEPKPGWHSIEVKGSKPHAFSAASSVLPLRPRP